VGAMLFLRNLATLPKEHLFIVEHEYLSNTYTHTHTHLHQQII
jgi:L-lactate utilization protein LutC